MADGGLIVELDETLSKRLEAAAASAGQSPVDYALSLISAGLDEDWAEDDARFAEFERTGESLDAEEALLRVRASLVERFSAKA